MGQPSAILWTIDEAMDWKAWRLHHHHHHHHQISFNKHSTCLATPWYPLSILDSGSRGKHRIHGESTVNGDNYPNASEKDERVDSTRKVRQAGDSRSTFVRGIRWEAAVHCACSASSAEVIISEMKSKALPKPTKPITATLPNRTSTAYKLLAFM